MATVKAIKRKAQVPGSYREALIALGWLSQKMDVLRIQNGDLILFCLNEHSEVTNHMMQAFIEVSAARGVKDIQCFLAKPGDSFDKLTAEQFEEIALSRGFVREVPNAGSIESAAAGDGDRGTPSGETPREEPGAAEDVEEAATRLCSDEGEGPPAAEGLRTEAPPWRLGGQSPEDTPTAEGSIPDKRVIHQAGACEGFGDSQGGGNPDCSGEEPEDTPSGLGLSAELGTFGFGGVHLTRKAGEEDGRSVLPARDEKLPGSGADEGKDEGQTEGEGEGVRAEEAPEPREAGQRLLSDKEVDFMLDEGFWTGRNKVEEGFDHGFPAIQKEPVEGV